MHYGGTKKSLDQTDSAAVLTLFGYWRVCVMRVKLLQCYTGTYLSQARIFLIITELHYATATRVHLKPLWQDLENSLPCPPQRKSPLRTGLNHISETFFNSCRFKSGFWRLSIFNGVHGEAPTSCAGTFIRVDPKLIFIGLHNFPCNCKLKPWNKTTKDAIFTWKKFIRSMICELYALLFQVSQNHWGRKVFLGITEPNTLLKAGQVRAGRKTSESLGNMFLCKTIFLCLEGIFIFFCILYRFFKISMNLFYSRWTIPGLLSSPGCSKLLIIFACLCWTQFSLFVVLGCPELDKALIIHCSCFIHTQWFHHRCLSGQAW